MNDSQFDSGTDVIFPMEVSFLRRGGYIVLSGRPCKISDISISKTTAEVKITALDIFTGRKYESIFAGKESVEVPYVTTRVYDFISVDGGEIFLLDEDGDTKLEKTNSLDDASKALIETTDLDNPDEQKIVIYVVAACGEEHALRAALKKRS